MFPFPGTCHFAIPLRLRFPVVLVHRSLPPAAGAGLEPGPPRWTPASSVYPLSGAVIASYVVSPLVCEATCELVCVPFGGFRQRQKGNP